MRALVLDLDDTLLDHTGAVRTAVTAWAAQLPDTGSWAGEELVGLWQALERRHYPRYLAGEADLAAVRRTRVREFLQALGHPSPTDEHAEAEFGRFLGLYRAAWRPFPDVAGLLARARRDGLALAVLTNGHHEAQEAKLRAVGVRDVLLLASSRLPAPKPDPRAYAAVETALGVSADALLMVGDDPENDVLGPLRAGWRAVHLDRPGRPGASAVGLDAVARVSTLDEVRW